MALLSSFNEGSLLRRTLLHVGTFVLGSMALLAIMSLVLVSIARGVFPGAEEKEKEKGEVVDIAVSASPKSGSGVVKPPRKRKAADEKKASSGDDTKPSEKEE